MREPSRRAARVADLIRQELGQLLEREVKDPRVGFVTLTSVQVTADLRTARVAVSVLGDETKRKESLKGLGAAQGFLRHELAQRLGMRYTPVLVFELDRSLETEQRMEELLHPSQESNPSRPAMRDEGAVSRLPRPSQEKPREKP